MSFIKTYIPQGELYVASTVPGGGFERRIILELKAWQTQRDSKNRVALLEYELGNMTHQRWVSGLHAALTEERMVRKFLIDPVANLANCVVGITVDDEKYYNMFDAKPDAERDAEIYSRLSR